MKHKVFLFFQVPFLGAGFLTSRVPDELRETEVPLESNQGTGLVKRSILRLDYLMTVLTSMVSRKIGSVDSEKLKTISDKLALSLGIAE